MSLTTPSNIRELQIKLYRKAKNEPGYRFYLLYDKIYREDILSHAYKLARANKGAPGVDGRSFDDIESTGLDTWLTGILPPADFLRHGSQQHLLAPSSSAPSRSSYTFG